MPRSTWRRGILVCVLSLGFATVVVAQGTTGSVNGTVNDNTGAVLPGVSVTASGPAIMGTQTAVTNEQGQYRFPSLPPGTYRIQYELAGFSTVIREGIIVNVGFSSTINVQLQLATLAETVTVTGQSPVVDTQNTNIQTNFTQEMIKSLPNARDIWALIAVAPGTTMNSFDVGGSRAGTQTGYSAYGRGGQVRVQVDGANATEDTGSTGYFNYGAWEEVQIGTDSNDASMPTPGVQINAVVKSGGNQFRGDMYIDFQHENLQNKNVTLDQKKLGAGEGTRITKYYDPNIGIGGPIKQDKLWYYVNGRNQRIGTTVSGFPVDNPSAFEFLTKLENISEKITYQLSQNNKISQFFEMRRKLQPSRGASSTNYQDSVFKQESMSSYGTVELSSVISPTFFMNSRLSSWGYNWPNYPYGTDGLQQNIQHRRTERNSGNVAGGATNDKLHRRRWQIDWTGTLFKDAFMGGNHTIRMGFTNESEMEKDLDDGVLDEFTMMFDSLSGTGDFARPWRIQIANTPRLADNRIRHRGAFVTDQFVVSDRVTLNLGLRWDDYHVFYPDQVILGGRYTDFFYRGVPLGNGYSIPASFTDLRVPGNDEVIRFATGLAPRFGIAYDPFGSGKTVLKANWGRYQSNPGPQNFTNPVQGTTYTFTWLDCRNGSTPVSCTTGTPTPGDRRFTDNEFGTFVSSSGGVNNTISPDLKQEYVDDMSFFVEQELMPNLGIRAGYVRKQGGNNWQSVQVGRPYAGYTDVRTFADPGPDGIDGNQDDGPTITAYDYPANVTIPASRTDLRNRPEIESWDNNVEFTLNKRMSDRWSLVASFLYNWDHSKGAPQTPNAERFNETDLTNYSFKFFGTYRAPWDITINPVMRFQQGANLARVVSISLRSGTLSYQAEAPGTYRGDNVSIFDLAGERRFSLPGNRSVDLFVAAFNLFNSNAAVSRDTTVGRRTAVVDGVEYPYARFLRPSEILPPRVLRFGAKLAF